MNHPKAKTTSLQHAERAYYDARYENGKFIDLKSNQEIVLKEGATVRITTAYSQVLDEEVDKHSLKREEIIIPQGEVLQFKIQRCCFAVELSHPLYLTKEGNRHSRLSIESCIVIEMYERDRRMDGFQPIEVSSLNQAYTQTSSKYFRDRGTHTRNVFDVMEWKGKPLKHYRKF